MPWKETCPMQQRQRFIEAWLSGDYTVSDLSQIFTVSRKTAHKWIRRFKQSGYPGLEDRSRAPRHHPNQTPEWMVDKLLALKHRHPLWGPVTLVDALRRTQPDVAWPAASTAGAILKRYGLVKPRRRPRPRTPPYGQPLAHADAPHAVWSADFKGDFVLGDGSRCYPLTISDNYSRYLITCQALPSTRLSGVQPLYRQAFKRHGLPLAIRTDNGAPFASVAVGGLSTLSIWLIRLGIRPERIEPGCPQQNPRHERMHRTLKAHTAKPPKASPRAQQRAFNRFTQEYNEVRPHRGLNGQVPADHHQPSHRAYPRRLPELIYPQNYHLRRVRHNGEIKWQGRKLYLSQTLKQQTIALKRIDQSSLEVYFGPVLLAILDETTRTLLRSK